MLAARSRTTKCPYCRLYTNTPPRSGHRAKAQGRFPRIDQAARLRSVELSDIDAAGFGATRYVVEKVAAIGQKLWERMTRLLPRLKCCHRNGVASFGRNPDDGCTGVRRKHNGAF